MEYILYCQKCGKQIADGSEYCPECGASTAQPTMGASGRPMQPSFSSVSSASQPKKKKTGLWITLGVIAVIIIAVAVGGGKGTSSMPAPAGATITTTAQPTADSDKVYTVSEAASIAGCNMAKKALVVEDDGNIAELLRLYLEKDGFEVAIASDGGTGVRLAQSENPDVILLDIMQGRQPW